MKGKRFAVLLLGLCGCGEPSPSEGDVCPEPVIGSVQEPLSTIDCSTSTDTGYTNGQPFPITVVTVDGKKVEQETANAYYVMAQAASADGVEIRIVSGFRTMSSQEYLYACYVNCNCNSCNLAAKPGYSNHQSGHALDLNTSAAGVLAWLNAHGAAYGFKRTVPSEAWHWEWWNGGPGGGPCGSASDAGADEKGAASGGDAASSDGHAGLGGGEETRGNVAGDGDESVVSNGDDVSPGVKPDAGGAGHSATDTQVAPYEAGVSQNGCACRMGAEGTKNRGPFAALAALLASLALLVARRRPQIPR